MKQTCLLLGVILVLRVPSSFEDCVTESVQGVPHFVCNSVQELEKEGNSNLFDVDIYHRKPSNNVKQQPSLKIVLTEDNSVNGISPNTIRLLKELSRVFSHNSEVDTLPAGLFINLPLQELNLQNNGISNIASGAFSTLTDLQKLYIVDNKLSTIKYGIFNNLPMELLALSNNRINFIEREAFQNMTRLKQLRLDGNRLWEFQPEITMNHPRQLQELLLQNNLLTEVDRNTVRGLENLKVLNLNNNKISRISSYTFDNMQQLEVLNLGNNMLLDLAAEVFPTNGMPRLQKLYLHYNRLSFLTTQVLERLRNLRHIRIGGNPWQCPCLDVVTVWIHDHEVDMNCDKGFFIGTRPVCVVSDNHPYRCIYMNDAKYFEIYNQADNKNTDPECVL